MLVDSTRTHEPVLAKAKLWPKPVTETYCPTPTSYLTSRLGMEWNKRLGVPTGLPVPSCQFSLVDLGLLQTTHFSQCTSVTSPKACASADIFFSVDVTPPKACYKVFMTVNVTPPTACYKQPITVNVTPPTACYNNL